MEMGKKTRKKEKVLRNNFAEGGSTRPALILYYLFIIYLNRRFLQVYRSIRPTQAYICIHVCTSACARAKYTKQHPQWGRTSTAHYAKQRRLGVNFKKKTRREDNGNWQRRMYVSNVYILYTHVCVCVHMHGRHATEVE